MLKKLGIDSTKRAGELTREEEESIVDCVENPLKYGIPKWFVNRPHDYATGAYKQVIYIYLISSFSVTIFELLFEWISNE